VDLFGRRTIKTLKARIERVEEQRDYHKSLAKTAQSVATRTAAKFNDNHALGWAENSRLTKELAQARRDLAARDDQIRVLRAALAAHGEPDDDRASQPAVPLPADMEMARRNRLLQEQNAALQERLDAYRAREMAADWQPAEHANAGDQKAAA
jgi:predicted transposase YbfD/YdcC